MKSTFLIIIEIITKDVPRVKAKCDTDIVHLHQSIYYFIHNCLNFSKISAPPLGQKKDFNVSEVYHMQNNQLGTTVSTKQTKIQSDFLSSRYWSKHAEIWRFGLDTEISALFGQYLELRISDWIFVCFVETLAPSRSFCIL